MSARVRELILIGMAALLAVIIGFYLADESYMLGGFCACVVLWVAAERMLGALPDAWILGVFLIGYIVGNRGFAQIFLLPNFPLLPAEAALLVCVPALLLRMAFKQTTALLRDGLNFAILAWMLCAAARLPLDLRRYGFEALRDSAAVYYACFFFITQAFCRHESSRRWLEGSLTVAFLMLPLASLAFTFFPDILLTVFTWRGVPLIYHKGDLVAMCLAGAFFYFWSRYESDRRRTWLVPAAVCLLMSPTVGSPRASMFGAVIVTVAWLFARRWRLLAFQVGLLVSVVAVSLPVLMLFNKDVRQTTAYSVYEHAISIFDVEGTGTYLHAETGDPGANNRFRLVWWSNVAQETLETNPVFGLGFGADLAARFLANYDLVEAEDFVTRSPHSIIMTVFGRMGLLGLGLFFTVVVMMARSAWPAFARRDFRAMGLWSVAWVTFFSACFGVVLEGPMGAVLFWTVLGMAHDASRQGREAADAAAKGDAMETVDDEAGSTPHEIEV